MNTPWLDFLGSLIGLGLIFLGSRAYWEVKRPPDYAPPRSGDEDD